MSKTISIADDVYNLMKSKKGDRSFSEFIRSRLGAGDLAELQGTGFSEGWEDVDAAVSRASETTRNNIEERTG